MDPTKEEMNAGLYCRFCQKNCGEFMLKTTVWQKVFPDYGKFKADLVARFGGSTLPRAGLACLVQVCIPCVEERLGRSLVIEDFRKAPINDGIFCGFRMGQALTASKQLLGSSHDQALPHPTAT